MKETKGNEWWRKREETPTRRIWISCELASAENWSILSCGNKSCEPRKKDASDGVFAFGCSSASIQPIWTSGQCNWTAVIMHLVSVLDHHLPSLCSNQFSILSTNIPSNEWKEFLNSFIAEFLSDVFTANIKDSSIDENFLILLQKYNNPMFKHDHVIELKPCFLICLKYARYSKINVTK